MERLKEIAERLAVIRQEAEVENADLNALEAETKQLTEERAAIEAKIEKRKTLLEDIDKNGVVIQKFEERKDKKMEFEKMTAEEIRNTEEYRSAFLKRLQGKPLNDIEKRANEMASTDVAGVIPTMTQSRIFDKLKEYAPLLSEVTLLQVPGNVTFAVESTNTAAALHAQNTAVSPSADTMTSVTLGGFEIIKVLRISATVQAMAINAFEGWLTDYLARGIAAKVGSYIIYGSGSSQPKGIDYMDTWVDGTNAVDWAGTSPTTAELVETVSYLKAGYHRGAKWLMNAKTFWARIAAVQDNSKYKILTDDYKRLLGYEILLDDNVADDDIFFGNFREGIVANFSQNIKVDRSTESGFLNNAVDYRGTAIFDCDLTHTEGFIKSAPDLTAGA
jgi:HK97 family phage major capsid protein